MLRGAAILHRCSVSGHITEAVIEGRVYRPVEDQAERARDLRLEAIESVLTVIAGEQVKPLLEDMQRLWWDRLIDLLDEQLRRVGWRLLENGQEDLWLLIYAEAMKGCAIRPEVARAFLEADRGE